MPNAFGDAIYNVGFTAHAGEHAWFNGKPTPLPPPPSGSLEELWGATGHEDAFVDLRRIRPGGEWLVAERVAQSVGRHAVNAIAEWQE